MRRLLLTLFTASAAAQAPVTFPEDGGVVDVRAFGAKPGDDRDDTAAIQKALDLHPNGNRIVHLPPGTWIVTDTLRWPAGSHGGQAQKRTILQGAGPGHTVIRLPDETPGFAGAASKALIWTGSRPAQRFRNAVRDLAIEVGRGNPSAIEPRLGREGAGVRHPGRHGHARGHQRA